MTRILWPLTALLACGPRTPAGESGDATTTTGTTTHAVAPTTTGDPTTGDPTTGDPTTGDGTTGFDLCPWELFDGEVFCPLLAAPNTAVAGDTPHGPVALEYGYFGLFRCGTCPYPGGPTLALFAQPQQAGLSPIVGDFMRVKFLENGGNAGLEGEIGGVAFAFYSDESDVVPTFSGVVLVTEEEMETPLDPATPPTIRGNLEIDGDGWAVAGAFTASLCTTLDAIASCE